MRGLVELASFESIKNVLRQTINTLCDTNIGEIKLYQSFSKVRQQSNILPLWQDQ